MALVFTGGVAAALAGTPLFLIATDSRVLELAQYHNIPYQLSKEFDFARSIRDIYETTDFNSVNKGHKERYENFKNFLAVNGMSPVELPNKFFDKKIEDIQFYPPVTDILNITAPEIANRLNKYYGHLMRKEEKITKEISQCKKERDDLRINNVTVAKKAENMKNALEEIKLILAEHKIV